MREKTVLVGGNVVDSGERYAVEAKTRLGIGGDEERSARRENRYTVHAARREADGRTRKVETTCRNNVRVFDLEHVTEPH